MTSLPLWSGTTVPCCSTVREGRGSRVPSAGQGQPSMGLPGTRGERKTGAASVLPSSCPHRARLLANTQTFPAIVLLWEQKNISKNLHQSLQCDKLTLDGNSCLECSLNRRAPGELPSSSDV